MHGDQSTTHWTLGGHWPLTLLAPPQPPPPCDAAGCMAAWAGPHAAADDAAAGHRGPAKSRSSSRRGCFQRCSAADDCASGCRRSGLQRLGLHQQRKDAHPQHRRSGRERCPADRLPHLQSVLADEGVADVSNCSDGGHPMHFGLMAQRSARLTHDGRCTVRGACTGLVVTRGAWATTT
jgi:hypothetical protein